jgi:hypothetical protein
VAQKSKWWPMSTSIGIFWPTRLVRYPWWHLLRLWRHKIDNSTLVRCPNMP